MTSKTPSDKGATADSRLDELMRADAAAVIDDDLDDTRSYSKAHGAAEISARSPSQVYSIRVPVDRLEQVRSLASARGLAPTAMMRQWVLARLDDEMGEECAALRQRAADSDSVLSRPHERSAVSTHLEAAASALAEAAAQMMKTLTTLADIVASQRSGELRPQVTSAAPAPFPMMPIAAAPGGFTVPWASQAQTGTFAVMPMPAAFPYAAASIGAGYVYRGVAALQSTVQAASAWPGVSDYGLDNLYAAADEVATGP
jgi:hypothetical protein